MSSRICVGRWHRHERLRCAAMCSSPPGSDLCRAECSSSQETVCNSLLHRNSVSGVRIGPAKRVGPNLRRGFLVPLQHRLRGRGRPASSAMRHRMGEHHLGGLEGSYDRADHGHTDAFRFAKAHDFPFPYLHDETQTVARAYGAVCTPDFFGYNADRKLRYRGRLDEGRTTPPRGGAPRELVEAMRAIATTGVAPGDQKASIGCSIKWKDD